MIGGKLRRQPSSTESPSAPIASRALRGIPAATGVVIQFGCLAPSESPGHPENVTTVGTCIFSASRTVCRNSASAARATAGSGCSGLPWHERALIVRPASASICLIRRRTAVAFDHLREVVEVRAPRPAARAEFDRLDVPQRLHLRDHLGRRKVTEYRCEHAQFHRTLPASSAACTAVQTPPRRWLSSTASIRQATW